MVFLQVKPYNVYITINYPPDTDTPLLHSEDETKVSHLDTTTINCTIICTIICNIGCVGRQLYDRDPDRYLKRSRRYLAGMGFIGTSDLQYFCTTIPTLLIKSIVGGDPYQVDALPRESVSQKAKYFCASCDLRSHPSLMLYNLGRGREEFLPEIWLCTYL